MADGLIALGLLVAVMALVYVALSNTKRTTKIDRAFVGDKWRSIVASPSQDQFTLSSKLTEADKLLDHVLKAYGFRGQTMGERLKSARPKLRDNNAVWQAHKLRNQAVHEARFNLTVKDVNRALDGFKKALRDLGAL